MPDSQRGLCAACGEQLSQQVDWLGQCLGRWWVLMARRSRASWGPRWGAPAAQGLPLLVLPRRALLRRPPAHAAEQGFEDPSAAALFVRQQGHARSRAAHRQRFRRRARAAAAAPAAQVPTSASAGAAAGKPAGASSAQPATGSLELGASGGGDEWEVCATKVILVT